ncbi:TPA: triose-phosphate isomerase [Legionella pneumophila]|uniref:Triosephosphate isomerase n=2 Tax=Legionella pneumophila TaxID=446 RepID=TPIS_LEGPA|nr:triose-phosphate isomerase [Legionella pneumophila]Q5X1A5.1 RecName: Full=Triosephosphate isomerase; Short=TIM; Short=TPI; AltName: Full=Triose-phosphate isomerase [Legionella pneumophila str. Paris]ERH40972.1 triosephosphate isomerase [Legionella pneumophila str. Leg01/53]ERH46019.1 triosephosphate isomerase [Legionella pneumophila str. Leg01/11]ANN96808.1 triose-phosphate isomerase [Legionella pneumophila]ERB42654.1 triosephosphate isomerase [Legionella pneumophila str. 121004]MCW8392997
MRQKIVAGNWKMNGQIQQVTELVSQIEELIGFDCAAQVAVMPPSIYIPKVRDCLKTGKVVVGAQNVYPKDYGAYTGELSAPMLKDFDCRYVLVGHSERRQFFHEDENFVAQKFHHVKDHGMIPILCVGETLSERENGKTEQVIAQQVLAVSAKGKDCFRDCVVAYEPVWAIGTGKTATPEQAQKIHQFIRDLVGEINDSDAKHLTLIYGGSVNENNAKALFSMPDIDGGLVGGASLNAKQFVEIVKCIN